MKEIGKTTEGNYIIEASKEEYAELVTLKRAVEGSNGLPSWSGIDYNFSFIESFDFTKTFQVIRAWYLANMKINYLQEFIDEVRKGLKNVE